MSTATKMAADKDTKDEIVAVGPGVEDESTESAVVADSSDGYQYPEAEGDEERQETGDERVGHAEEESEEGDHGGLSREQRRRKRKREKYAADQRELHFLRQRNEQLEREQSRRLAAIETRQAHSDVAAIDQRISLTERDIQEAESLWRQATQAGDTEAVIQAQNVRDQLKEGLQQLKGAKAQTLQEARQRQQAPQQAQGPDPAIAARADAWRQRNPWFNPQVGDEDSLVASAVEQALFREGRLSPASDAYWKEYDRRLAQRLPSRRQARQEEGLEDDFEDDEPAEPRRRMNGSAKRAPGGPTIKVGGRERQLRKGEVYVDEDRKQAMIESGVWDDPVRRKRVLERYQQYDREAGRRTR